MDNSSIALLISIVSVLFAALSLGWNIYRDIVIKARVTVSVGLKSVSHAHETVVPQSITISAVNHGPATLILDGIYVKNRSIWRRFFRKTINAYIMYDYENPYSSKLPLKLGVGETAHYYLTFDESCLLREPYNQIGLSDTYGRTTWAKKSDFRRMKKIWQKRFGNQT